MSSASRVPLLVGNKGRKPTRLPIAPRARPSNVDRVKRPVTESEVAEDAEEVQGHARPTTEANDSPERKALPPVLSVSTLPPLDAQAPTPAARVGGGISPGHSISASRTSPAARSHAISVGVSRSPLLSAATGRSPGQPVERLAKITSKTTIPLFRPPETRTHASPILGPRATPIPAPHGPQTEVHDPNPVLKRLTRKLDIKPHQSPRRIALNHNTQNHPAASPLLLSSPALGNQDVPFAPLDAKPAASPKKRGAKRRIPSSRQENVKNAANKSPRRSLRRKVKKEGIYVSTRESNDGGDHVEEEEEYEDGVNDEDEDEDEDGDDGLSLPDVSNPPVYMPARERATLWAKKVLRQQEEVDQGVSTSTAIVKKEKRIRSNSTSSVLSVTMNPASGTRKSKAEELLKKEPSQMTMGELALSIPKGRRMLRHEQEESADSYGAGLNSLHRSRSLSLSSETPSFGGSIVTPHVEIIDGKMVISESTVKISESAHMDPPHDFTDDSVRRPRGARYLAANSTPGRRWTKEETKEFYYCLSQVGPNFSMMATLFPTRKRKELKSKFKYEEKHHPGLIEIALKASTAPLDSEIVDVISQMADKEVKKREEKRRKHAEATGETGLSSPATVSSTAVPTPPPDEDIDFNEDEQFGEFYRERKNSFDFAS